MEVHNVSAYIAYTNRYNGKSAKTNFGMINLADRKDPNTMVYDTAGEGAGKWYNLDDGPGVNCPAEGAGNPDPDYENAVELSFKYVESPPKSPAFTPERKPANLSFVQMTYFDFDSGADGANGIGKECVRIDGALAEYGIHPNTELRKDTGIWDAAAGAYKACPADNLRDDEERHDESDQLIESIPAGDMMLARGYR